MSISDEQLMAYADGEVDDATRSEIESEIERDPALAARVEEHRQLRAQLQNAFAPIVNESVPDRLLAAIKAPANEPGSIADLNQARERRTKRMPTRWAWREWGAMAASLLLGVLLGRAALESDSDAVVARNGELVASGALADALEHRLSNEEGFPRIGLSFRSSEGEYCRSFVNGGERSLAGFACRDAENWRVRVLSETRTVSTEYELAASQLPPVVLSAIDQAIESEPLTIEEERAARERGWREIGR